MSKNEVWFIRRGGFRGTVIFSWWEPCHWKGVAFFFVTPGLIFGIIVAALLWLPREYAFVGWLLVATVLATLIFIGSRHTKKVS